MGQKDHPNVGGVSWCSTRWRKATTFGFPLTGSRTRFPQLPDVSNGHLGLQACRDNFLLLWAIIYLCGPCPFLTPTTGAKNITFFICCTPCLVAGVGPYPDYLFEVSPRTNFVSPQTPIGPPVEVPDAAIIEDDHTNLPLGQGYTVDLLVQGWQAAHF